MNMKELRNFVKENADTLLDLFEVLDNHHEMVLEGERGIANYPSDDFNEVFEEELPVNMESGPFTFNSVKVVG